MSNNTQFLETSIVRSSLLNNELSLPKDLSVFQPQKVRTKNLVICTMDLVWRKIVSNYRMQFGDTIKFTKLEKLIFWNLEISTVISPNGILNSITQ